MSYYSHVFSNCTSLKTISFKNLSTTSGPKEFKSVLEYFYENIFNVLCDRDNSKAEYDILLKLNNNDYRKTVLEIEYKKGLFNND